MASSSTALSKTAINTLRGVLFTTSLSVVLLAEERRRRIKIARAAVDNARKIHAAKANRSAEAAAAIEPFDLEAHLARLDSESFIRQPRAQRSLHRRTREIEAESSRASSLAITAPESHPTELAAPIRNIPDNSIALTHIAEIMANTRGPGKLPSIRCTALPRKSQRKTIPVERVAKLAAAGPRSSEASTSAHTTTVSSLSAETSAALPGHRLEYEHLIVTPRDSKEASVEYNDAVAALIEAALALPENLDNSEEQSSALKAAVAALQGVSAHEGTRRSFREILKDVVVNLLKYSVDLTADEMKAVLKASLFLKRSIVAILTRFLAWMDKHRPGDAVEVARNIIAFFTQPEQASLWKDGLLVQELIKVQSADSTELAIREYTMLTSAGLFAKMRTPEQEYDIRKEAIIAACSTGQTRFIDAEMIFLRELKGKDVETDFELQSALMTQQVALGACDTVFDSLRNLEKYQKPSSIRFQAHLRRFTDLFAKAHDGDELCQWLEYAAETYGMVIRTEWAFAVLNGYACYHDIKGMISWLEFCLAHGLKVDYKFALEWKKTCRGHLRFSKDNTQTLWERMEEAILLPRMGGNDYQAKQRRDDLSKRMAELNNASLWEKSCLVFEAALSKSRDTCQSSLELALDAHVQASEGNAEPALRLLERARNHGKDTNIAQHQFLAKEIKSRPIRDIKAFLFLAVECGSDIPADLYTLAVKRVVEKDLYAAHDILQLGVKQLGHGKLAYNGYCFAKLLYIHIATHRYDAALRLVSEFVSDKPFWHGTRLCKESIKFGIRELTKRAAAGRGSGDRPESNGGTLNYELRLTELLQQALEQNAESRHEVGYQTMISDMILNAVEKATKEKDAAAALEWQRKKLAKRAAGRTASNPRAVTLRQGSIAHISIDT